LVAPARVALIVRTPRLCGWVVPPDPGEETSRPGGVLLICGSMHAVQEGLLNQADLNLKGGKERDQHDGGEQVGNDEGQADPGGGRGGGDRVPGPPERPRGGQCGGLGRGAGRAPGGAPSPMCRERRGRDPG